MKTCQCILTCLSLSLAFSLTAQKDYSLKNFKSPPIRYQGLDVGANLIGTNQNLNNLDLVSNDGNFAVGANARYFNYTNLNQYVGNQFGFFDGYQNISSQKSNALSTKHVTFDLDYSFSSENRFYYRKRSTSFLGIHGIVNGRYQGGNSTIERNQLEEVNEESRTYNFNTQVYLSYGYGRIEPVRLARLAYDTYNLLASKNRLARNPTQEEIDKLADVMNWVENTRFFDSRFKRIFQLEQVDSVLQSTGAISEADMVYFAQVADVWSFALNFERGTGKRWELGLMSDYQNLNYTNVETSGDSTLFQFSSARSRTIVNLFASYLHENPISIKWQSDWRIIAYSGLTQNSSFENIDLASDVFQPNGGVEVMYRLGWYPTTRTAFNNRIIGAYSVVSQGEPNYNGGFYGQFRSNLAYWISARLRLNIGVSAYLNTFYTQGFSRDFGEEPIGMLSPRIPSTQQLLTLSYNLRLTYGLF